MMEFELLNCLLVPTGNSKAVGREPISQETYFSNSVDMLSSYPCRNCGSHSLFKGFFFIQCKECMFEFMDESELTQVIVQNYKGG